jgi:membrane protease YdiL (CAAX protease family)
MKRNFLRSLLIILVFLIAVYGDELVIKYFRYSFDTILQKFVWQYSWFIVPIIPVTGFLFGFRNILKELRIHKGFFRGLSLAFICVLPMFISSAFSGRISEELSFWELMNGTVFAGFFEEILFRAFLFGLLFRKLNWGFLPASVLGAVIFGIGHLYQSDGFAESVAVFTVTFMGAVWFAWLFIEWKENLWVPIFMHTFMNLSWILFDIAGNVSGDLLSNIFRIITIGLSIILTVLYNKKKDYFRITDKNMLINKTDNKII